MGKKGTPHRKWSKEEKLYYIHLHLDEHLFKEQIAYKVCFAEAICVGDIAYAIPQ